MISEYICKVKNGQVFLAIHPEETEIRAWIRIWGEPEGSEYNEKIPCGESYWGYAGKKKYINLPRFESVLV